MIAVARLMQVPLFLVALLLATPGLAKKDTKLTLGVFLPTAIADGQERFALGEKVAKELSEKLGVGVVSKNFARFEDFQTAANGNKLDLALIDGWMGVELRNLKPFALANTAAGTHERWAVITRSPTLVKDLIGKKLAVPRGARTLETRFVSNVLFEGDFPAKNFKLTSAPNIDSVLKLLETKKADAAVVPTSQVSSGSSVIYRSTRVPHVLVVGSKQLSDEVQQAVSQLGAIGPFKGFKSIREQDLAGFTRLLASGPPKRQCLMVDSPVPPLDTTRILELGDVGFVMPSFTEFVEIPAEQPDP